MTKRTLNNVALLATGSLLLLAACGGGEADAPAAEPELPMEPAVEDIAGARAAAGSLGLRLKTRLVEAMQDGGPAAAVAVCAQEAPLIAQSVSQETGYEVGRSALRVRNAANTPDDWERRQLIAFMDAVAAGEDPAALETAEIVRDRNGARFRWAKPIVLQEPCATCHGTNVDPALLAQIRTIYPDDAATGFEIGAVRGVFTVEKRL